MSDDNNRPAAQPTGMGDSRAEFEKAFSREWSSYLDRSGAGYKHGLANVAWWAWQAARQSAAAGSREEK